ncbi:hypothetical protein KC622_00270 [Candidatus Dojkabacteria bacterium]|uniref:Uncharacterized protein n=1 Tax=Candidatus Dojkabacteria bacterium TaxID=2099670 RepID=A0A955HX97_9BACT|nr:hypothetical protein [Candidatus Dojkabacteria bacterium]
MTLTEAAFWTRRLSVVGSGALVLIIILIVIILNISKKDPLPNYLQPNFTCTLTKDEMQAQKLQIPSLQLASGSNQVYEIDTPTGKLEKLPLIANVYKFNNPGALLNAQEEARKVSEKLSLEPEAIERRGTIEYHWNEDIYGRTLTVDANTLNFHFQTNFRNANALPETKKLPTENEAKTIATGFLRANGWLLEDYSKEEPLVTPINIEANGSYTMATSRAQADLLRVDYFRSRPFLSVRGDIEKADEIKKALEEEYLDYNNTVDSIVTDSGRVDVYNFNAEVLNLDTQKSNLSVYVGSEDSRKKINSEIASIYEIDYTPWIIADEPCGTYPLVSATELTTIIEKGNGSLVYLNEKNGDTVVSYQPRQVSQFSVKQVRLAYLDTLLEQRFLQPIYVVSGEATFSNGTTGTFYYYIPAIDYNNIQDPVVQETQTTP